MATVSLPRAAAAREPVVTRAEFDALVARVTRIEHARDADDAAWVHAVAASTAAATFTARELRAHARVDHALRRAVRGMTAREIGARLRRLRDHALGGLVVRLVKRTHGERIWWVSVVDDRHANPGVAPPSGAE